MIAVTAAAVVGVAARATVLVTVEEAVKMAFPAAVTERQTLFLSDSQREHAGREIGASVSSSIVTRFEARADDGSVIGWAYLDTHRVRTLPETLLIVVDGSGSVQRVEVVTFREPLEYMPKQGWYEQYRGKELDDNLALKRDIRPVTGATLTASATTEAVRRVLAIHRAVTGGDSPS